MTNFKIVLLATIAVSVVFTMHVVSHVALADTMPVSYWNFDESATGTGTADDIIDGNDGTFVGTTTRTTGLIGTGAALFDGTGGVNQVAVTHGVGPPHAFCYTTGMAIEALFKPGAGFGTLTAGTTYQTIFRKDDYGDPHNIMWLTFSAREGDGNQVQFVINDGTGFNSLYMSLDGVDGRPTLADLKDGNTHHIVGSYDSTTGFKAIYVDGTLGASTTVGAGVNMISGGTGMARIGNVDITEVFEGVIDEVAIYNTALSGDEIASHWSNVQAGNNYFVPEPSTLVLLGIGALGLLLVMYRRRK